MLVVGVQVAGGVTVVRVLLVIGTSVRLCRPLTDPVRA